MWEGITSALGRAAQHDSAPHGPAAPWVPRMSPLPAGCSSHLGLMVLRSLISEMRSRSQTRGTIGDGACKGLAPSSRPLLLLLRNLLPQVILTVTLGGRPGRYSAAAGLIIEQERDLLGPTDSRCGVLATETAWPYLWASGVVLPPAPVHPDTGEPS